jgi:hypothetical protein
VDSVILIVDTPDGERHQVQLKDASPGSTAQGLQLLADEYRFRAAPVGSPLKQLFADAQG